MYFKLQKPQSLAIVYYVLVYYQSIKLETSLETNNEMEMQLI